MRNLILEQLKEPTIFNDCIDDWPLLKWTLDEWSFKIGDKPLPFRTGSKKYFNKPQWEGDCGCKNFTIKEFIAQLEDEKSVNEQWFYFDYKHMQEWFNENPTILKSFNWGSLGFPERGGKDSTLWISSQGAHTPCHVDTYGCNLVAQIYGRKQWILFPPDSEDMKPTRVPYEESSIYSEVNFYSPSEGLRLKGAREAGLEEDRMSLEYLKRAVTQCTEEPDRKRARMSSNTEQVPPENSVLNDSENVPVPKNMNPVRALTEEQFVALVQEKRAKFPMDNCNTESPVNKEFQMCQTLINSVCDKEFLSRLSKKLLSE
ncbi:hypothetical protein B566_EDAN010208 [Ephemera danica]|nr:hypothetical protein B566_EDAN010208 [Ephemera danica]